jgi:hypothetical protein
VLYGKNWKAGCMIGDRIVWRDIPDS